MSRILIIEDDMDLREGLAYFLEKDGYEVLTAGTKRAGMEIIRKALCDLILLDCNLPDGSGFDLCTEAKEYGDVPILMLTARDTEMDEVKALEMGVADYMSKPFSIAVLKARIKKILQGRKPENRLVSGGITLEKDACKVYKNGEEIRCSKVEYQLLMYFMENRGRVLSKEQILAHVWDSQGKFVDENTLSVNIRRLRGKIEDDPKHPALIRTVHGIGYVWRKEEE
ncbi:MAG TPA: response regulator transcription factor [Candidatus Mediterraneibacter intestinavium]|nr:response regulator transcription factor [Candidatus Mediterraneibacter intestinavium]